MLHTVFGMSKLQCQNVKGFDLRKALATANLNPDCHSAVWYSIWVIPEQSGERCCDGDQ